MSLRGADVKKFIIDLNDNEELKKIENNKIEINEKVIVSIQEDLKNKAIIECRLTKLLTKLSDENREITIENNNQEYQIELDYINFKKFTVKDLIKKEKINFINLNSINLTIKRGFYKIINTVCKEMIIKNETIRSIEFSNVKLDNIVFESLKLNRLKFENSEINQINFKKLEFSEDFSIKNSKVNEISIENICVYNWFYHENSG